MNENDTMSNSANIQNPTPEVSVPVKQSLIKTIWNKIPQRLQAPLRRFYQNKKIFWLVSGLFGLIFLTLIIGLILGQKGNSSQTTKIIASPTPQIQTSPEPGEQSALDQIETRLRNLRNTINNLDVRQSRLQPVPLNFNISF